MSQSDQPDTGPTQYWHVYGRMLLIKDHRWGDKDKGWFVQRSGDRWCPAHIPEWVESWRANRR